MESKARSFDDTYFYKIYQEGRFRNEMQIWRYMDFPKFANMVVTGSLYFSSANRFNDALEGIPPKKTLQNLEHQLQMNKLMSVIYPNGIRGFIDNLRNDTFINCWTMNESDAFLLWGAYGAKEFSVSIQSTIGKFNSLMKQRGIQAAPVLYLDHERDEFDTDSYWYYFLQKRNYFESEREFRAVVHSPNPEYDERFEMRRLWDDQQCIGLYVKTPLKDLIDNIYIPRQAPTFFFETVQELVNQFISKDLKVRQSEI